MIAMPWKFPKGRMCRKSPVTMTSALASIAHSSILGYQFRLFQLQIRLSWDGRFPTVILTSPIKTRISVVGTPSLFGPSFKLFQYKWRNEDCELIFLRLQTPDSPNHALEGKTRDKNIGVKNDTKMFGCALFINNKTFNILEGADSFFCNFCASSSLASMTCTFLFIYREALRAQALIWCGILAFASF